MFVLDGVLIGAGDAPYLAGAMAAPSFLVFAPAAVRVLALDGSLTWLWAAICLFMAARLRRQHAALRRRVLAGDRRGARGVNPPYPPDPVVSLHGRSRRGELPG